jgi:hypothetical protein
VACSPFSRSSCSNIIISFIQTVGNAQIKHMLKNNQLYKVVFSLFIASAQQIIFMLYLVYGILGDMF